MSQMEKKAQAVNAVLIAALVAVVAVGGGMALWSFAVPSMSSGVHARGKATEATMRTIESGLKAYKADKGRFPANLRILITTKMIEDRIKDAWNQDIEYRSPGANGKDYSLISPGPDGRLGTDDDIDIWKIGDFGE